jgi:protein-tyrosine phosphatase
MIRAMTAVEPPLRSLPNLRDVGGHVTADGRRMRRGVVFRSEAPSLASAGDVDALAQRLGIAEVIDLRRPDEQQRSPLPPALAAGARWHRVPFEIEAPPHASDRALSAEEITCADMGRFYAWMAWRNVSQLRRVLGLLAELEAPALVHCAVGKDRTGVAVAVALLVLGAATADVIADYARSDAAMAQVLPRHDAELTAERIDADLRLRAPAASMAALLEGLAGVYGSLGAFLAELDAGSGLCDRLRRRLLA